MAKISIDLKTDTGDLGLLESEVLFPTPRQVAQAFAGALFTTQLIGKATEFLEVIKINFSQRCLDDTHTKEKSALVLRLTAIMSHYLDKDHKVEACLEIGLERGRISFSSKEIAQALVVKINMAITSRLAGVRHLAEDWENALRSSIRISDSYFAKK